MKKLSLILLLLSTSLLCACGSAQPGSLKEHLQKDAETSSTPIPTPTPTAEEKFLVLFEECYKKYEAGGKTADLKYAKLEDMYQANPGNVTMKNLYYFCNACGYYRLADITGDSKYKTAGNKEAAKIDPNYRGPYYVEVITFAKEVLGSSYEGLSEIALKEQENFDNLTLQDKKDIINTITSSTGKDMDQLWEEIANKYGISTDQVSLINIDSEAIAAIGEDRKAQAEADIAYDAMLEYGEGTVVIANTKKDLDKFLTYVANGDDANIQKMVSNFSIAYVPKGTKVEIIEKKAAVANVKILTGFYKDVNCWTIIEAVKDK